MKLIDKSVQMAVELFPTENKRFYHFAFAYRKNRLLAIGQNNMSQESPKVLRLAKKLNLGKLKRYPFPHAEIDLVSRMIGRIHIDHTITVVVIRLNRFFVLQHSKPCKHCRNVLNAFNVREIWYSTADNGVIRA